MKACQVVSAEILLRTLSQITPFATPKKRSVARNAHRLPLHTLCPMKFPPIHARVIPGVKSMPSRAEKCRGPLSRATAFQSNPACLVTLSPSNQCENSRPEPSTTPQSQADFGHTAPRHTPIRATEVNAKVKEMQNSDLRKMFRLEMDRILYFQELTGGLNRTLVSVRHPVFEPESAPLNGAAGPAKHCSLSGRGATQ